MYDGLFSNIYMPTHGVESKRFDHKGNNILIKRLYWKNKKFMILISFLILYNLFIFSYKSLVNLVSFLPALSPHV